MNPERAVAYRKQASILLESVILGDVSAREALNCWPRPGNEDPSVQCAYTMLWFFESDEDRHHLELYYSDLQLKTLQEAAQYLRHGNPLPASLLHEYQATQAPMEYNGTSFWQQPWWRIKVIYEGILKIIETNPLFHRK